MSVSQERPSRKIIERVAEATETDSVQLPPLYDDVDPDALDTLIQTMSDGELTFTYSGVKVTITSDESIKVNVENDEQLSSPLR